MPDAQSVIVLPDTLPKEDLKGVKNAAESLNLQWTDVAGGVKQLKMKAILLSS